MSFFRDLRVAFHSLMRSKGLAAIVILTLALGIGANAAIFTLVRGVLLKPLVNRDENRLMYIRQSAPSRRTGQHHVFRARNQGHRGQRPLPERVRRFLADGLYDGRTRRTSRSSRRRRQRQLLRSNGSASCSRPSGRTCKTLVPTPLASSC